MNVLEKLITKIISGIFDDVKLYQAKSFSGWLIKDNNIYRWFHIDYAEKWWQFSIVRNEIKNSIIDIRTEDKKFTSCVLAIKSMLDLYNFYMKTDLDESDDELVKEILEMNK